MHTHTAWLELITTLVNISKRTHQQKSALCLGLVSSPKLPPKASTPLCNVKVVNEIPQLQFNHAASLFRTTTTLPSSPIYSCMESTLMGLWGWLKKIVGYILTVVVKSHCQKKESMPPKAGSVGKCCFPYVNDWPSIPKCLIWIWPVRQMVWILFILTDLALWCCKCHNKYNECYECNGFISI